MLERERDGVAAVSRRLAGQGLVLGTAGNVSALGGELVAITPTGAELGTLQAADVAVVDLAGRQIDGPCAPSSELELHLGVYRHYGAGAVVHTHAPVGTALSCVLGELPVVHYHLMLLGGAVRVVPYTTFGSGELAELTIQALAGRRAALMANHGAIAYGPDLEVAVARSLLLEWVCTVYWRAAAIGTPRALSADEQAAARAALERAAGEVLAEL
jgi:L-fuculose-phosphate aldolase